MEVTSEGAKDDVNNVSSTTNASSNTGVLSFRNLDYTLKVGRPFNKVDKTILRDVSGVFEPGLNAIMGPTGGGKTSLLDLLAKRRESQGLKGDILLNGKPLPKNFKLISGYVVQDDVVMGTLTVKENLEFAANLRMRNASAQDKTDWVKELILELGLVKCQDTKVGTDLIKGVSGGERKRCNIGIELVTKPPVLFLDEPTTGLDASTSFSVLSLLRDISLQDNRTIVFSIHQPRYSIFRLFDRLHLLSSFGQTVFHGPAKDSVGYFARHGMVCETYNNPADFYLDVIIQNSDPSHVALESDDKSKVDDEKAEFGSAGKLNLAKIFAESEENANLTAKCKNLTLQDKDSDQDCVFEEVSYATNWYSQFYHQSVRSFKNLVRNPQTSVAPSLMMIVLATLIGCLYLDWTNDLSGFQNLFGALFFATLQMMFGNMAALEVFISGRNLFLHESANGFYRVSSFFVSKVFCDLLPLRALPTVIFSVIFYIMLGLERDLGLFLFFLLVNMITTMAACSLAFFVSVASGLFSVAQALVSVTYIVMVLFAGLVLNVKSMPEILQPIKYLSIPRYCLESHAGAQMSGMKFCGSLELETGNGTFMKQFVCENGSDLLEQQDIDTSIESRWFNCGILLFITMFLFFLTYCVLRFMPKRK